MFNKKIGIDLGTANILVYIPGKGIVINEPTVVAVSADKKKILAIGTEAKVMVGKTPDEIIAYRPMKDGVIADYRVTEAMIAHFIEKTLGKYSFFKPDILLSVPAGINSTERRAVIESAIKAGARTAQVVKEPILGAIGAGIKIEEPGGHMIVDIGGGTVDVAIISLGGIVEANSVKSAGDKMDQEIIEYMKREYSLAIGEKTAEDLKIEIGAAQYFRPKEELFKEVRGIDYITELPKTIKVGTNDIVTAISRILYEIIKAIKDVLAVAPPEVASDIITKGILLTGGTSQLRKLPDLIKKETGIDAFLTDSPLTCVAEGTGIALGHLDDYKKAIFSTKK